VRSDFCVFILTYGRAGRVKTASALRDAGYSGLIYFVVDDEDNDAPNYIAEYGDSVVRFCKSDVQERMDDGDNLPKRDSVVYARNATWDLAKQLGIKYFMQLDDDYNGFYYRFDTNGKYGSYRIRSTFDALVDALISFYDASGALSVALSQGGDHIGGAPRDIRLRRKAMNSFLCSVDKPFLFKGRMNDDVNTYIVHGAVGGLFFTVMTTQLNQAQTQSQAGGLTEMYLEHGTYTKSCYTVMMAPSCTKVAELSDPRSPHRRLHHRINWNAAVPVLLHEKWRK